MRTTPQATPARDTGIDSPVHAWGDGSRPETEVRTAKARHRVHVHVGGPPDGWRASLSSR